MTVMINLAVIRVIVYNYNDKLDLTQLLYTLYKHCVMIYSAYRWLLIFHSFNQYI